MNRERKVAAAEDILKELARRGHAEAVSEEDFRDGMRYLGFLDVRSHRHWRDFLIALGWLEKVAPTVYAIRPPARIDITVYLPESE